MIDLADRAGVPFAAIGPETRRNDRRPTSIRASSAANPLDAWGTGADFVPHVRSVLRRALADDDAALGLFCADSATATISSDGFADAALAVGGHGPTSPSPSPRTTPQVRHDALAIELTEAGVPVLDGTWNALVAVRGMLAPPGFSRPAGGAAAGPPGGRRRA